MGIDIDALKKENEDLKKANAELQQKVEELTKKVNYNSINGMINLDIW